MLNRTTVSQPKTASPLIDETGVGAHATSDFVVAGSVVGVDDVPTSAAMQAVRTKDAFDRVVTESATEQIIAIFPEHNVGTNLTQRGVILLTAVHRVATGATAELVPARSSRQSIVPATAADHIGVHRTYQVVAAGGTADLTSAPPPAARWPTRVSMPWIQGSRSPSFSSRLLRVHARIPERVGEDTPDRGF